ncbi:hypothetical protein OJ253_1639 [Cryptosporidium canis]|uniref:Snurportin-1 n=1 Tax=Cryptosporidium canis TaxID=195482 RepID=A0A9D5HYX8_9CRYT|nr:hypothetical protein OJ253_1639 [Cryptosporidium canis]
MISNYNSYYKLNHGFIKEKPSDVSSVDKKLREMLEKLRKERRQEFLKLQRIEDNEREKSRKKSSCKGRNSKYIRDWKLSKAWSNELMEYKWLSRSSEGYRSIQDCPQEWLILPLCKGRRSMLIQGNGYCELRNQDGWRMFTVKNAPFAHNGLTIIDGIYNRDKNTFYCNDLIVWNNLNMCTSTTDCRLHFLFCRIEEYGVKNITTENNDVCMISEHTPKLVHNIRIELGRYFPLSRDSLLNICGANGQFDKDSFYFDHLVFVRRDSMYEVCNDNDQLDGEYQTSYTDYQHNWFIWRDKGLSIFCSEKDVETEAIELIFRLNINEKNQLYTKDGVFVGKVNCSGIVSESLSLDNDQKFLKSEYGRVFVYVKFGEEDIPKILNTILPENTIGNCVKGEHTINDTNLIELCNVSPQDKVYSGLDNSDYIQFRCIEEITKSKYKYHTINNEFYLNLNMDSLLNYIS